MTAAAEALILAHLDLVERLAKLVAKRMPAWIQMDELVAAGNLGLCQAAEKYQPELNPSFGSYAALRIYGAMVDPYRGRNYPRLTTAIPDEWLDDGISVSAEGKREQRRSNVPPQLIDPSPSPEDLVIADEENFLLILDVEFAKHRLSGVEQRAVRRNVAGQPMRLIGKKEKKSGAWAHYTIHRGRRKLRELLAQHEDKAA